MIHPVYHQTAGTVITVVMTPPIRRNGIILSTVIHPEFMESQTQLPSDCLFYSTAQLITIPKAEWA
jgi:hypothetical protein